MPQPCAELSGRDAATPCPLCAQTDRLPVVWSGAWMRLVRADDAQHPAFYRVIWQAHRAEFSDLSALERSACMDAVVLVEQVVRGHLAPDKVNLATLGNVVPHLHWHVIARWHWDTHWPQPVWGPPQRAADLNRLEAVRSRIPDLDTGLRAKLQERFG
ncbi:MAG: HIT family protein [Proteobacteria bacterium]|nr:HIT family protein [Pseudomonadota bacterium]